ncbi:PadR family transcriptional regulator [Clostridium estertheticum]|uniref:PadR family transcriptional regulator n=1 Tax=Clostridium estertheticum TaxID=238834 RepID=UPI001923D3AF|nr:helix-turn-helix transcriptional regulator [Clostridium estertheticum]MBZ9687254.1 PadR family transcriptional regulator [Clostridium estertheticum]
MARGKALDEDILTDSTYYILLTLVKPMHGYGIMQEINEFPKSEMVIGPASLYTIIKKLQSADLILLVEDDEEIRKTYTLTLKGKEILKKDIKRRIIMVRQGEEALKYLEEEDINGKEK